MIYRRFQKYRKTLFMTGLVYLLFFSAKLLYDSVPDDLYVVAGEEENIQLDVPVSLEKEEESVAVFGYADTVSGVTAGENDAEYSLSCRFLNLIPIKEVAVHVVDKSFVMPSGIPVGIYAKTQGVLVLGTGKVTAADGLNYEPAYQLLQSGDYILSVDGKEIHGKSELIDIVNTSEGKTMVLGIQREEEWIELKIKPVKLEDGTYKLGVWVRDDMAGVGTMTYVEEDFSFGALGHPVSDADTGSMLTIADGSVYDTDIVGIVKGEDGTPGELTGVINYNEEYCLGSIQKNTQAGIYGELNKIPEEMPAEYMEVGLKQDIQKGEAYIISSLDGELQKYRVEIDEIDFNSEEENKGILFHVVDSRLIEETGGVVQGMFTSYNGSNNRKASKIKGFLMF
ncbi:MAG: SpoIVB peptidase [Lachnospiraceae bacterium]|nr:SpoIVB peptidase [Lachnospiraceae bacterium]